MELFKKNLYIENNLIKIELSEPKGLTAEHRHEFFEIEYILSGSGIEHINGVPYNLEADMILFTSPADFHKFYSNDLKLMNIIFPIEIIFSDALYSLMYQEKSNNRCIKVADFPIIKLLMHEIVNSYEKNDYESVFLYLSCALTKLCEINKSDDDNTSSYLRSAIVYISQYFNTGITLSAVANHVGLSEGYLSTIFHKTFGVTFKSYLDDVRFTFALKLLKYTDLTVCEICHECGFSDFSNFMRRFKYKYKKSPGEYRKQFLNC